MQRVPFSHILGPHRHDDRDRAVAITRDDEAEDVETLRIYPVHVVHCEEDRRVTRQVVEPPVELNRVQHVRPWGDLRRARAWWGHALGKSAQEPAERAEGRREGRQG